VIGVEIDLQSCRVIFFLLPLVASSGTSSASPKLSNLVFLPNSQPSETVGELADIPIERRSLSKCRGSADTLYRRKTSGREHDSEAEAEQWDLRGSGSSEEDSLLRPRSFFPLLRLFLRLNSSLYLSFLLRYCYTRYDIIEWVFYYPYSSYLRWSVW